MGKQTPHEQTTRKGNNRPPKKLVSRPPQLQEVQAEKGQPSVTWVEDVDLKIYVRELERLRIRSVALINESGYFIFFNKLAREHFEGSLNNLANKSIFELMVPENREKIEEIFHSNQFGCRFKCIIYSKNTKRKYTKLGPEETMSKEDVYFRYLKGLSCNVRALNVHINTRDIALEGTWIRSRAIMNRRNIMKCYILETRLSTKMPPLPENLLEDPIIKRYLINAERKGAEEGDQIKIEEFSQEEGGATELKIEDEVKIEANEVKIEVEPPSDKPSNPSPQLAQQKNSKNMPVEPQTEELLHSGLNIEQYS